MPLPFVPGWMVAFGPLIGLLPIIVLPIGFVIGGDLCIRAWVRKQPLWLVAGVPLMAFCGGELGIFFFQGLFR